MATLELLATLLCVIAFGDDWAKGADGGISVSGSTDNAGNACVVSRLMSSKFPLVVVLAELACQLRSRRMDLCLDWIPRDQNEAADALSNSEFAEFDEAKRIHLDVTKIEWQVLEEYMLRADALYAETKAYAAQRAQAPAAARRGRKKGAKPLRQTDPW